MNPADVEQRSEEWRQARCGFVTASRICDVIRKPRRGQTESVSRKAYLAQVVAERLTGKVQEREFESYDTRRGEQMEPLARVEYEMRRSVDVLTVGFVEHPTIKFAGCSPDGLVGDDGLCQIKAPRQHVHMDYLLAGIIPVEYRPQMLFELACTGRQWTDFVSYNRDLPDHLQLFMVRLRRDKGVEAEIADIEAAVREFHLEVEDIMARLPQPGEESSLERQLKASIAKVQEIRA